MSLLDELKNLVGDEKAEAVLQLVKKPTPMQKYLATPAGKAAKKRANDKWRSKSVDKPTILAFLKDWAEGKGKVYETGTALWKEFSMNHRITRKDFISHLPALPLVNSHVRNGKRIYTPTYEIDVENLKTIE